MNQPAKISNTADLFPNSLPTAVTAPPTTHAGRPVYIRMVFDLIKEHPGIATQTIVKVTQLSTIQIQSITSKLVQGGMVRREKMAGEVRMWVKVNEYRPIRAVAPKISNWEAFRGWLKGLFQ